MVTAFEAQELSKRFDDIKDFLSNDITGLKDDLRNNTDEIKDMIKNHLKKCEDNMKTLEDRVIVLEKLKNKMQGVIWVIGFFVTVLTLYILVKQIL